MNYDSLFVKKKKSKEVIELLPTLLQENTFIVINLHLFSIARILPYRVTCNMGERKLEEELEWFDTSGISQFVMTRRVEWFVRADLYGPNQNRF